MSGSTPLENPAAQIYPERTHQHEATILQVAAECIGVSVGRDEAAYWRAGAKVAAALDGLVDEAGKTDVVPDFYAVTQGEPIGPAGIMSSSDAQEVATVYDGLSVTRRRAWMQCVQLLPSFAKRESQARTVDALIDVRLEEAGIFAGAFQLDADERPDAGPVGVFNRWLVHFARASYMIDSALDMPIDYRNRSISVAPTPLRRAAMLLAARRDIKEGCKIPPRALAELGRTAFATIQERNRAATTVA